MTKLTSTQSGALLRLADGPLSRRTGGFWTYRGCPDRHRHIPTWSVEVGTIRALVRRDLAVMTKVDDRVGIHCEAEITEAGRAFLAQMTA